MAERSGKVENKKITLITENVGDHRSRIHAADFSIEIRLFVRFRDAFAVKGCTIKTWVRHLRGEGSLSCQRINAFNVQLCCFSTNCIVWIKPLKIILPGHPHSISFENVIASYYFILLIHTNLQWSRFSIHLPAITSRVALLNVKSLVYWNKSCTNRFYRRGYGLKENDSYTGDWKWKITYRIAFTKLT